MGGCASAPVVYEYTERDSEQYEAYAQDEAEANYASRTTPDTIGGEPISPDQEYAVELYLWAVDLHKQLAGQHAAGGKIAGTAGTAVGTGVAVAMGVLSEAAGVLLDAGLGLVPAASGVFKFIMDDRRKSRYPQARAAAGQRSLTFFVCFFNCLA